MKKRSIISILLIGLFFQNCYYDNKEELFQYVQQVDCTATTASYSADIVPILTNNCLRCHSDTRQDGNVNLEGYNNTKRYADNGTLYGTMAHEAGFTTMPTSGNKTPFCDIEKVRIWIEAGMLNN